MSDIADGGRLKRCDVDTTRLTKWSSRYSIHTLVKVGADRLVLRATNLVRGVSITFLVVAAAILLGFGETNTLDESKASAGRIGMGGLCLVLGCGIWLAPQRVVFDRSRGRLSRRFWFFRFSYPLTDIVAVQIIDGGWQLSSDSPNYETRELNLVLNSSYAPRVELTNHGDHATTRSMANEITRFLGVPLWDEFEQETTDQAALDANSRSPVSKLAANLGRCARICYLGAFGAAFFCVVLSLQQSKLDELEADLQPVRARLISTEVKQWIAGHDNWAAFGTFEIKSDGDQYRAQGNLIPQSFYEARGLNRRGSYDTIPRHEAEKFFANWQIGKVYEGYVYPDAPDRVFFELPGAEANSRMVRRLGLLAASLLALGLLLSACVANINRRKKVRRVVNTVSAAQADKALR